MGELSHATVFLPTFQVLELAGSKPELTYTYQAVCSDALNSFPQGGRSVFSGFSYLESSLFMPGNSSQEVPEKKKVRWWSPAVMVSYFPVTVL